MRIKNIEKVKEVLKAKLPEYIKEMGLKVEGTKVQCPHKEAHDHGDTGKLSAAYLPQSNNTNIFCFVENRTFDIFDVHSLVTGKQLVGDGFYQAVEELAAKYGIPLEMEEEFSLKEKEKRTKQKVLEELHNLSLKSVHDFKSEAVELYKQRNLSLDKVKYWKIGYLKPELISKELDAKFKNLYEYKLTSVFRHPALVIPVFNQNKQYVGVIMRQFGGDAENKYLNISLNGRTLFNIHNVRGNDKLTVVEGPFDTIALYPEPNVVSCLTSTITDADLEMLATAKFKSITLALDPDNFYKGKARDGFLKSLLKLKNLDTELKLVKIPGEGEAKPDPDEYMKVHSLDEFHKLPRINALDYLIENYQKNLITVEVLYEFIAGCPNLIRKEQMVTDVAKHLNIGKRQLMKSIESISEQKDSFNMVQYAQEKDGLEDLLEGFTEMAWNQNYKGVPSGFSHFDKMFGGFEDTLYLMVGFPEMGKTTFLLNFVYQLARNPNAFVAFYSLDDGARRSIIPRLMSIVSGLTSRQIKQPEEAFKDQWFNGLKVLQSMKNNLVIKDGSEIRTINDLDNYIKIHNSIAQERGKKLIVVIDNLHDINHGGKKELESTQNSMKVASYLKRLPQEMNCPIIATAEVPKSASDKPTGKDIKESIDLWYAARFVGGIFSDFHNEAKRNSYLVWNCPGVGHQPIMELLVSKNQTGDANHGSLFFKFNMKNNTLTECTLEENEQLRRKQSIL